MQFTSGYTSSLAARAGAFGRVRVSHRCFKNVQLTSRRASWLAGATPAGEAPARIEGPATADSAAAEGSDEDLDEKEKLRRSRISQANSGRTPWNKGRKHSPETLAKIRERTKEAMNRKEVMEKVKAGQQQWMEKAKQLSSEEAAVAAQKRERTRLSLLQHHAARKQAREEELASNTELAAEVEAKAAQRRAERAATAAAKRQAVRDAAMAEYQAALAAAREQGLEPPKPSGMVAHMLRQARAAELGTEGAAAAAGTRKRAPRAKSPAGEAQQQGQEQQPTQPAEPRPRGPRVGGTRSPEHRAAIAEAIRRKWQDPEYRANTVASIRRSITAGVDGEGRPRRRSGASSDGEGSAANTRAPSSSAARRTTSRASAAYSEGDASRMAEAKAMRDPSTVRSTRSSRGGGRHLPDVPPEAAAAAAGKDGGKDAKGGAGAGKAGGAAAGTTRRRRTKAAGEGGGEDNGAPGKSPDAARLELVRKLVGQVLTAERLVANTENLMAQFQARQHALRNDPLVRRQADAHLASVAATLQQARAKLDALRSKIPRDARYNANGDVWFVATPAGGSSSSGNAWPGSRDALGASGLAGGHVHDGDVWVGVGGRSRDAAEGFSSDEDDEEEDSADEGGGWRGLGGAAPPAEGSWSRSFLDVFDEGPGSPGAAGGDALDVEAQWVDRAEGYGAASSSGSSSSHGAGGSSSNGSGGGRRLNGYADHHDAASLNGNGQHAAASDYDEDHDVYGTGGRSPVYSDVDEGGDDVNGLDGPELADDYDDWDPEQGDPDDFIRLSRRPPPSGRDGSGGGGGDMEDGSPPTGPGFGRSHASSAGGAASTSGRPSLTGTGGGSRTSGAGGRRTAVPSSSGSSGSGGPGLGSSLGAFSGVAMPPLGDEDRVRVDLSALDPGNILGFEAVNGHHKPKGGAEPEPEPREGDAGAGDGDMNGGRGGGGGGVLKGGGGGDGRWPSGGVASSSAAADGGTGGAAGGASAAVVPGPGGASTPVDGSSPAGGSHALGDSRSSGSSRVAQGPAHHEHTWIQPPGDGSLPEPLAQLLRAAAASAGAPVAAATPGGRRLARPTAAASPASASSSTGGDGTGGSNIAVWLSHAAPTDLTSLKAMLPASHDWLANALDKQQQQQQQRQQQQGGLGSSSVAAAAAPGAGDAAGQQAGQRGHNDAVSGLAVDGAGQGPSARAQQNATGSGAVAGTGVKGSQGAAGPRARRKTVGRQEVAGPEEAGADDAALGRSKPRARRRELP